MLGIQFDFSSHVIGNNNARNMQRMQLLSIKWLCYSTLLVLLITFLKHFK
jgi:hypothetical protein